ncbi:alpha/beta hydrolase [Chthonobacter albigriseus]|uniref:alpha/beta hydrolase n=1 Tax=Chthonobacter albigriseus TaxID=1683161 RepID=UPI0015EF3951|nr:alpha/beta hydrolase [Chthonobacter albigriseus]
MPTYLMTARALVNGAFTSEPGPIRALRVPNTVATYNATHEIRREAWFKAVRDAAAKDPNPNSATWRLDAAAGQPGDVLFYVHGYNNDLASVLDRQRALGRLLRAEGWHGVVVGLDWPSDNSILNYIEDRSDGAAVARALVEGALVPLCESQENGCQTNVHLIGHSTGAYVIMKAFEIAPDRGELHKGDWRIGQVAFISGDVASASLSAGDSSNATLFSRIMRLTNFSNGDDRVLAVSNAKRLGVRPRAGRVGLPPRPDPKAVNVDCTAIHRAEAAARDFGSVTEQIVFSHGFYFESALFARDLAMTLEGAIDRQKIPTRRQVNGELILEKGDRPDFQKQVLGMPRPQPPRPVPA